MREVTFDNSGGILVNSLQPKFNISRGLQSKTEIPLIDVRALPYSESDLTFSKAFLFLLWHNTLMVWSLNSGTLIDSKKKK